VEWKAFYLCIHKTTKFSKTLPTVRQGIRWVAHLGGFLRRKLDVDFGNVSKVWLPLGISSSIRKNNLLVIDSWLYYCNDFNAGGIGFIASMGFVFEE